jgi:hypothetical protein
MSGYRYDPQGLLAQILASYWHDQAKRILEPDWDSSRLLALEMYRTHKDVEAIYWTAKLLIEDAGLPIEVAEVVEQANRVLRNEEGPEPPPLRDVLVAAVATTLRDTLQSYDHTKSALGAFLFLAKALRFNNREVLAKAVEQVG